MLLQAGYAIQTNYRYSPGNSVHIFAPVYTTAPSRSVDTETEPLNLKLYIVQKGDTLAGICRAFYGNLVPMEEIKGINQITDEDWIYAGQELYLP